jgi:hypothetical protein
MTAWMLISTAATPTDQKITVPAEVKYSSNKLTIHVLIRSIIDEIVKYG